TVDKSIRREQTWSYEPFAQFLVTSKEKAEHPLEPPVVPVHQPPMLIYPEVPDQYDCQYIHQAPLCTYEVKPRKPQLILPPRSVPPYREEIIHDEPRKSQLILPPRTDLLWEEDDMDDEPSPVHLLLPLWSAPLYRKEAIHDVTLDNAYQGEAETTLEEAFL